MSFEEFKGWLRGFLENFEGTDGVNEAGRNRILEELEKVEDVQSDPVHVMPVEVDPYATARFIVPTFGDGFVWNDENVRRFNWLKTN